MITGGVTSSDREGTERWECQAGTRVSEVVLLGVTVGEISRNGSAPDLSWGEPAWGRGLGWDQRTQRSGRETKA